MRDVPTLLSLCRFGLSLVLLAFSADGGALRQTPGTTAPGKKAAAVQPAADWKEIDRLASEQKFEEAVAAMARLRQAARGRGDETEWTRALIREAQLRTGLHGYETAVRFLRGEPWPKGLLSRTALELYYAQSLVTYLQAYSWEIQKRERVETSGIVDLKAWTGAQIYGEAVKAYARVWQDREALGREDVKALAEFLDANDYPGGVRGTLRDAVTYLLVSLLADTSGWTPAQSNEVFRLDLAALLASGAASRAVRIDDGGEHPLVRLVAALGDLEAWHAGRGDRGATLEARLERLRRLFSAFTEDEDRGRIEKDLEGRLPAFAAVPWFAMGKAQLAEFVERPDSSGDLPRARAIAQQGARISPASVGGKRCLAIVKRIEAPDYQLRIMQNDGPGKRSILILHKNVRRLAFRAYRLDLAERVRSARNVYAILPSGGETEELTRAGTPSDEWTVALPATPDYRSHATYVTPPMKEPGLYAIAASGAGTFGGPGFPLVAANFIVSDLVLVTRAAAGDGGGPGGLEVQALSGETGHPAPGVEMTLSWMVWNPERVERVRSLTTDDHGLARFLPSEDRAGLLFLFARRGKDLALDLGVRMGSGQSPAGTTTSSLLFTDRSIYRPLQKILWKVLGYTGNARAGRFQVLPGSPVTVTLLDSNNQAIDSRAVSTNEFGSAAGEFAIPAGRALGTWRVRSSLGGGEAAVQVEEYKRPTFEMTWKEPAEPLRLNRAARLAGEARYYFGLPVATGSVRWRVTRTPQYFWWSSWSRMGSPAARGETVASGVSPLKPDGSFEVAFTPAADERLGRNSKELTYTYAVDADASDEGGETRAGPAAVTRGGC
jgi:hypothetical protein